MNYAVMKAYLDANVGTFGALDNAAAAAELMLENKSYDLPIMSGKQVKDAFAGNAAEWTAILAEGRAEVLSLITRDDLDPHGVDEMIFLQAVGANAPLTVAALNAARTITTSTAFIEGFGEVTELDVFRAREQG